MTKSRRTESDILYLIPDTNFFIQCRALNEILWCELGSFNEVHLIICLPVIREIDKNKSRGNDRLGRRSRKWNEKFGDILEKKQDHIVVQEKEPHVRWYFDTEIEPHDGLINRLDYNTNDDRIVGYTYSYRKLKASDNIFLLTYDTGVMLKSTACEVPYKRIPKSWLSKPENNVVERENKRLTEELARLRKNEPEFQIAAVDDDGTEIAHREYDRKRYKKLSEEEIGNLMQSLQQQFPMEGDDSDNSSLSQRKNNIAQSIGLAGALYIPPTPEEISKYQEVEYPAWLEKCKEIFETLHTRLENRQPPMCFHFRAANVGTRPADNTRVIIKLKGNWVIGLRDTKDHNENDQSNALTDLIKLPSPPNPPKGYKNQFVKQMAELYQQKSKGNIDIVPPTLMGINNLESYETSAEDSPISTNGPTNFEYSYLDEPATEVALRCSQWYHDDEHTVFHGELQIRSDALETEGAVEFKISAANLSKFRRAVLKIKCVRTEESTLKHAESLIYTLAKRVQKKKSPNIE